MTDLQQIKQAFIAADADGDSLLNREEFSNYVLNVYGKPAPSEMFDSLCEHFTRDPELGIDWNTAKTVWKQAQTAREEKNPIPKTQSIPPNIQQLKQTFLTADKDNDGYLKQIEFIEFAKIGFKKSHIPAQMYTSVCVMFNKDPDVGIDWDSALDLWKKSNPQNMSSIDENALFKNNSKPSVQRPRQRQQRQQRQRQQRRSKTPQPPVMMHNESNDQNNNAIASKTDHRHSVTTDHLSLRDMSSKSNSNIFRHHHQSESLSLSSMSLTKENLIKHTSLQSERSTLDTPSENGSETSSRTGRANRHGSMRFQRQRSTNNFDARPAIEELDATAMVVQMMDNKLKQTTKSFKQERQKKKKLEELTQTLLNSNEKFEQTIADMKQKQTNLIAEAKKFKESIRKLKHQLEDDRQTIQHLQAQRNTMREERDQSFKLLSRMETDNNQKIKILKIKQKEKMEQLSEGFLRSLGAEPGKDVRVVIKELRDGNTRLSEQVEMLAQTLARKDQSLLEALSAVDDIAQSDETFRDYIRNQERVHGYKYGQGANHSSSGSGSSGAKNWVRNMRQKSRVSEAGKGYLPKPPQRRNSKTYDTGTVTQLLNTNKSSRKDKPCHKSSATFFKRAVGNRQDSKLANITKMQETLKKRYIDGENIPKSASVQAKELHFLSQHLTSDVKAKQESIQSLQMANTQLVDTVQAMQMKIKRMKVSKNKHMSGSGSSNGKKKNSNGSDGKKRKNKKKKIIGVTKLENKGSNDSSQMNDLP